MPAGVAIDVEAAQAALKEAGKKIEKSVAGTAIKKTTVTAGSKIGQALGHAQGGSLVGGLVGATASAAVTKGAPKEAVKAAVGFATGTGLKEGSKAVVTRTTAKAVVVGATEASKATLKVAAAKGACAAASGGFASLGGELLGGLVGEQVGKKVGGEKGGGAGKEIGALSGATSAGAAAGGMVAGPMGALAGAGMGAASYGMGKVVGAVIDKAAVFEGVVLVKPQLKPYSVGCCTQAEATHCILTEEGLGNCFVYFFPTPDDAQKKFRKMQVSRILFEMYEGHITGETERAGWPWHQNTILSAANSLRPEGANASGDVGVSGMASSFQYAWTEDGVSSAADAGLLQFLGNPKPGDLVTHEQLKGMALGGSSAEQLAEQGHLEVVPWPRSRWTAVGVHAAKEVGVLSLLGNPVAGETVTDEQMIAFSEVGYTPESLARANYIEAE